MPVKRHAQEEEYFAREEVLKKQKLALEQAKKLVEAQKEELRQTHWMHCQKCGMHLQTITFRGVEIDRCFNCRGTWLDAGELEKVSVHEPSSREGAWVRSVLNLFAQPAKPKKK
jgi:uncharacterized protein